MCVGGGGGEGGACVRVCVRACLSVCLSVSLYLFLSVIAYYQPVVVVAAVLCRLRLCFHLLNLPVESVCVCVL